MTISVPCACGKRLAAPSSLAGKKARCPGCGAVLQVPAAGGAAAAPAGKAPASKAAPAAPPANKPAVKKAAPAAAAPVQAAKPVEPAAPAGGLTPGGADEYDLNLPEDEPAPKRSAAAPAQAEASHAAPSGPRTCPACDAPMEAQAFACAQCGFTPSTGTYLGGSKRYATHEKTRSFGTFLGVDLNVYTIPALLLVFVGIVAALLWFFKGPGAKFQVVRVQTVKQMVGLPTIGFEPEFIPKPGTITRKADADFLPDDVKGEYFLGGPEQLVVTRPDPNGDYVVADVGISMGLLRGLKQESEYDVVFNSGAFQILGGPAPITPALVAFKLDNPEKKTQPPLELSLATVHTADRMFLVPGRVTPAKEDLKRDDRNKIVGGEMEFDGKSGLTGQIRFRAFHSDPGDQFSNDSISGTGVLKYVDPSGMGATYSYGGSSLAFAWTGGNAYFTKQRFKKPQAPTDYHKYYFTMIFPRPKGVDSVRVKLADMEIGRIHIGSAALASAPPPDLDKLSGEPVTDYLSVILKAKKKAAGVVSNSNLRQIAMVLFDHLEKNGGRWPESLAEIPALENNLKNPRNGEAMGYIYVKPAETTRELKEPGKAIVIYEAQGGKPMVDGDVLYADGTIGKAIAK